MLAASNMSVNGIIAITGGTLAAIITVTIIIIVLVALVVWFQRKRSKTSQK